MRRSVITVAIALSAGSAANADLLFTSVAGPSVGPGMGATTFTNVPPPLFSNDDVPGQEQIVTIQVQKRFDATAVIDSPMLVNWWATAGGTPPVTSVEYSINEIVTNNTGQAWTSFEMELGEGLLAGFGPYTNPFVAVSFDVPNMNPAPVCSAFPIVSMHTPTRLVFSGGVLPNGGMMSIRFQMDNKTPNDLNFDGMIDMSDIYGITLREIPIGVPAPGAAALAGLAGLMVWRRRR